MRRSGILRKHINCRHRGGSITFLFNKSLSFPIFDSLSNSRHFYLAMSLLHRSNDFFKLSPKEFFTLIYTIDTPMVESTM